MFIERDCEKISEKVYTQLTKFTLNQCDKNLSFERLRFGHLTIYQSCVMDLLKSQLQLEAIPLIAALRLFLGVN